LWPVILVALLLVAQVPTVTVTTDRICYAPGDEVQVIVQLSHGWTLSGMMWFYIDKPDGHNLYFTYANLSFASATGFVFTLPQDAPEGNYTVTVTHDHDIYIQTTFIVEAQPVPEFPFPLAVLLVAFTVATLAISRLNRRPWCSEHDAISNIAHPVERLYLFADLNQA
jgi:hypothetical protein